MLRAEQSRAEQSRAEQSRAEQSRAEQSRAEQSINYAFLGCKSLYRGCKVTQIRKEVCVIFMPVFERRDVGKFNKPQKCSKENNVKARTFYNE